MHEIWLNVKKNKKLTKNKNLIISVNDHQNTLVELLDPLDFTFTDNSNRVPRAFWVIFKMAVAPLLYGATAILKNTQKSMGTRLRQFLHRRLRHQPHVITRESSQPTPSALRCLLPHFQNHQGLPIHTSFSEKPKLQSSVLVHLAASCIKRYQPTFFRTLRSLDMMNSEATGIIIINLCQLPLYIIFSTEYFVLVQGVAETLREQEVLSIQ